METRPLGRTGLRLPVIGVCPAGAAPLAGALPELPAAGWEEVRYNLLDQRDANAAISRCAREGKGVVAVHVLAGGALAGLGPRASEAVPFRCLVRPGRTLVQAAVQFVLANESVTAARVRVSSAAHAAEVLAAADAPPLTGRDLEAIFEHWANRFG